MTRDGILRYVEITANLGIMAGLLLVAVQIRQDREIADTSFRDEAYARTDDYYELLAGEDAAASMARAVFEPAALTDRDRIVLDALYSAEFTKLLRLEVMLGPDDPVSPATIARWNWDLLTNAWALAWWEANSAMFAFAPRHRAAIEAAMAKRPEAEKDQRRMFDDMSRRLAAP